MTARGSRRARSGKLDSSAGMKYLDSLWGEIENLSIQFLESGYFLSDPQLRESIARIIHVSRDKSYRYALLTQLLAKVIDLTADSLSLQAGDGSPGQFDARTFCKRTVVQFERKTLKNVLGASDDPYVSKPLRRPRVDEKPGNIKDKVSWSALYNVLYRVQASKNEELAGIALKQCLLEVYRLLQAEISPPQPLPDIRHEVLKTFLSEFLSSPSGGTRSQVIVFALLQSVNKRLGTFREITSARATTSDSAAGRLADIQCIGDSGTIRLGVAVTDELDGEKLESELAKAKANGLKDIMVVAHRLTEPARLDAALKRYGADVDAAVVSLIDFLGMHTAWLDEDLRARFVEEVYQRLREFGYYSDLRSWDSVVRKQIP